MKLKDKIDELLENNEYVTLVSKQKFHIFNKQFNTLCKFFDEFINVKESIIIPYSSIDMIFVLDDECKTLLDEILILEPEEFLKKEKQYRILAQLMKKYLQNVGMTTIDAQYNSNGEIF